MGKGGVVGEKVAFLQLTYASICLTLTGCAMSTITGGVYQKSGSALKCE